LSDDVESIYSQEGLKGLEEIPGVGRSIAKKIEEIIETGKLKYHQKLKKKIPIDFDKLTSIEGIGPKTVKKLYDELGIEDFDDLKEALEKGKIRKLEGFGKRSEEKIRQGLEFVEKSGGRMLLARAHRIADEILEELRESKQISALQLAGSARRMKDTVGDLDILAVSNSPEKAMDLFVSLSQVGSIVAKGKTKSTVRLKSGFDCDLRIVKKESFGSALLYFTGSKAHNIALRKIAMKKGLKLNEYGVFKKSKKRIAGKNEREVYKALGLHYIEPELRENEGEIDAAEKNKLPKLIDYDSIKGDFHMHSKWSDGTRSIKEMVEAAKGQGYEWVALTDHSKSARVANGLDERRFRKQWKEIEKTKVKGLEVLRGVEMDILKDGSLDFSNSFLENFDVVIGAIHSSFSMPAKKMTKRIKKALESGMIDILAHPTGRLIGSRRGYALEWDELFDVCKSTNTALEINAYQQRLDLDYSHIKEAVKRGVRLTIGTDAHAPDQLKFMRFGIGTARRGWAEGKNVMNTLSAKTVKKRLG
ncbi:DNA polymerase/3'-5' exonuclease PolX, partial [Candidatus Micrarchaeota archaeon]